MAAGTGAGAQTIRGDAPSGPAGDLPAGACDCHVHVFGPTDAFPYAPDRLYTPGPASIEALLALQERLGLGRVVVVQPSPYGSDNRCTLHALQALGRRARGVAVIDDGDGNDLPAMHRAGIRGARVNLETSHQHDAAAARDRLIATAERIAPLGWHLQIYTNLGVIEALQEAIARLPVPVVVDHFGRAVAADGPGQRGLGALLDLLRSGRCYVKVSAAHRVSTLPDCADAGPIVRAFLDANPARIVWGSDWPHPGAWPGMARGPDTVEPFHPIDDGAALDRLRRWCGDAATFKQVLVDNPAELYDFGDEIER